MKLTRMLAVAVFAAALIPLGASRAQSIEELPDSDSQQLAGEDSDSSDAEIDIAAARQGIIEQTNEFRREQGLAAVEPNKNLDAAAKKFAEFMAESRKYGHHADGRTPAQRAAAAGYEYCIVLENIAYRQQTRGLASVDLGTYFFEGWRDSPEHRENMLDPAVTDTGVGLAVGERGNSVFAVQLFGRPESKRLLIEVTNSAAETVQLNVQGKSKSRQFEIPPRAALTLQRCRPTEISLGDDQPGETVEESSHWLIQSSGDKNVLQRAEEQSPVTE